ncbi:hypothetical protein NDU88_005867 [Pleurodeles waltl]|uniref:Uncharacterized protein n=1 Tax=Pleurodeles waltl TaxID=8319 RepID=A0AAV7TYJ2_PLEWA|nr:hypothetical protein NDU88_005867 [Pleurodeles waltl]
MLSTSTRGAATGDREESVNKEAPREMNADKSGHPQSWDTTACNVLAQFCLKKRTNVVFQTPFQLATQHWPYDVP